ncbi:MAG: phage N-6-adenine-methyltransferase [Paraglaciecola sp.]|nr:phage N-6-adenine-methyltransferase [Paraglaciecola sp.]NCT48561.1 phage N-6-adenine-methyltransferase [Paraglaciecola sp.]
MTDLISSDLDDDMKNSWGTDPVIFNALNKEFNFGIDLAASKNNALLPVFFTKELDALKMDWSTSFRTLGTKNAFCNPPYGKGYIKRFFNKAIEQKSKGVTSVFLVPATLDAQWLPINEISEIRIITGGRLSFYHPITGKKVNGNTKGSMFVIFSPSTMPLSIRLVDRNELLELGANDKFNLAA